MQLRSLLRAVLAVVTFPLLAAEAPPQLPAPTAANVEEVLRIIGTPADKTRAVREFTAALDKASRELDPKTAQWAQANEGKTLSAKIVWLVSEIHKDPAHLRTIHEFYFERGAEHELQELDRPRAANLPANSPVASNTPRIVPHIILGPALRAEHLTEDYRAAWESLTLLGSFPSTLDRNTDVLVSALTRLGHKSSAIVLAYRCRPNKDIFGEPYSELQALASLPDPNTLRLLFDVVSEWQQTRPDPETDILIRVPKSRQEVGLDPIPGSANWKTVVACLEQTLVFRAKENAKIAGDWKTSFAAFPKASLNPDQRKIFDRWEAALQK